MLLTSLVCGLSPLWTAQAVPPPATTNEWLLDLAMRGLTVIGGALVGVALFLAKSAANSFRRLDAEFHENRIRTDRAILELHRKTEAEIAEIRRRTEQDIAALRLDTERRIAQIEHRVGLVEHEHEG